MLASDIMTQPKIILSQDLRWAKLQADPTCRQCGITKTIDDFPRKAVDYACNDCRRDYARNSYRKRRAALSPIELVAARAKVNENQNQRRAERMAAMEPRQLAAWKAEINRGNTARRNEVRSKVYDHYGYVCACCGETEPMFLTIDHINNDGAAHRRKVGIDTGEQLHRWLIRNNFPPGFQVLCMNCQWGKRNNGGICPHVSGKVQRSSRKGVGPSGPKRGAPKKSAMPFSQLHIPLTG